jgi:uncharacterized membrane protein YebE (DUF533 family)
MFTTEILQGFRTTGAASDGHSDNRERERVDQSGRNGGKKKQTKIMTDLRCTLESQGARRIAESAAPLKLKTLPEVPEAEPSPLIPAPP